MQPMLFSLPSDAADPALQPKQDMQLDRLHFTYERQIRDLHNHLYGNANIRTPEGLATEVLKVIKTLMHRSVDTSAVAPDAQVLRNGAGHKLAEQIRIEFQAMNQELRAYAPGTQLELDDQSVAAVGVYLAPFDFGRDGRDWLGDAIEILRSLTARRIGGQFFTHPFVTELAMRLLEYAPAHGLVDVCAGSGGFLLAAAESSGGPGNFTESEVPELVGIDVDDALVRLANSNLAMKVGAVQPYAYAADSLRRPESWPAEVRRRLIPGAHDRLASNPPFGSRLTVKDEQILSQFELAQTWRRGQDGWQVIGRRLAPRAPEVLFIERNLQLAKPGSGRVALVTPYQILSGPQAGYIRQWLLRVARIVAVVDLPADTFQPHTGTKASLLVYERRERPLDQWDSVEHDERIFMSVAEHIGHDRRGNPVFENNFAPTVRADLPAVGAAFEAFLSGESPTDVHPGSFVVSASDLSVRSDFRLNAAFHRPQTSDLRRTVISLAKSHDWTVTTIGAISERIFVPGRFKRNYVEHEGGIPFLGGTHIGQYVPINPKKLGPDDAHLMECLVRSGWILITRSGSTGLISSVPEPWDGWAVSDHVIRLVPRHDLVPSGYVEAYLRSAIGQQLLAAGIFGSVIDEITPDHVASLPIAIPTDEGKLADIVARMDAAQSARSTAFQEITNAAEAISSAFALSGSAEAVGSGCPRISV